MLVAELVERLAVISKVAKVLDSIPASYNTVESKGHQMKWCFMK
jgi:hypothetical protein